MRQLRPIFLLIALWGLFATETFAYAFSATNEDGVTLFYLWRKDKTELTVTFEGKTWVATESYKGTIRIPSSVTYEGKTYPVTRIGDNAFYNCHDLTSITIPSSINSIGDGALGCCWKLESLFIPKTVTTIGENAFMNDSSLISIVVEDGNPNYDSRNGCNAVIETATNTLLRGCRNTVFPDDIEAFGSYAMSNLGTITPQTLPNTVRYIGEYAFLNCVSITSLTIPGSVKTIDKDAFWGCTGLTDLTLEKGVETIAAGAFGSCLSLTELTLPATIQSLGNSFVFESLAIKTIKVLFGEPIPISDSTFNTYYSPSTMKLYVPKGCRDAFAAADYWKEFGEIIETDEEPELIDYFFYNINGTKMYFRILDRENKTVEIGLGDEPAIDTALSGELVFPSEVKGYTVVGIAANAFAGCAGIIEVTIPATITNIAGGAFSGNTAMTKVTYEGDPCPIATDAFDDYTYNYAKLIVDDDKKKEFAKTQGWEKFISLVEDLFIGDTFTDTTVEGIEVTYAVTSLTPKTVKVGSGSAAAVPSGTSGTITIPSSAKGYQVTAIEVGAFLDKSKVTEIILPSTITSIGDYAFCNTSIKYITLPASVQSLGTDVLYACKNIMSVRVLSTTPLAIKEDVFPKRASLTLYVPYGSKGAYQNAPYWKDFKEIVELPEDTSDFLFPGTTFTSPTIEGVDVLYIVNSVMPNTVKVASKSVDKGTSGCVTIPSNVNGYEVIGVSTNAFQDVSKVTQIILPSTVTTFDARAFYFCYAKEINVPEAVTVIPEEAFRYADITRITIPASVQSIGSNAFYKCDDLAFVFMESATPIALPEDAFPTRANVTLYVPYGSKDAYKAADYWKEFKEVVELPEDMSGVLFPGSSFTSPTIEGVDVLYTVTSLNPKTVKVASNAVSTGSSGTVTIPANVEGYEVTGISKDAFRSIYKLTEIKLPATITSLDERAFYFCYAKEINLPEGLTAIPKDAFYYSSITHITIPASVQTIGSNAFYKCDGLAFVFLESATPIAIPEDAFPTRANVTLYVPYGSKDAYMTADYWKEFKEIVELPEDMTGILLPGSTFTSKTVEGVDVLYIVTSLSPKTVKVASNAVNTETKGSVTIPSKVEGYEVIGIEKKAFDSIYGLTEITLPATITSLDENAFYFCKAKEINIPEGLTTIPNKAFYYSKITRITIPASVQTIGSNAFYKCDGLAFVFLESATPIAIPEDAFPTRSNVTLYVPYGSKNAYKVADYWKEFKEVVELPEDMTGVLLPGSTFTSKTVEGVDVLYTVQSLSPLTAKVASKAVSKDAYGPVTIPANAEGYEVIGIEGSAFESAYNLTEITLPATITSLDEEAFGFCYAKEINLPEGLTAIPKDAFRYADIIRIIIPASVQTIGNEAFYFCIQLSYVIMESAIPFAISEDAFPTRANVTLYVPYGSKNAYGAADYWKEFKEIKELPEDMTGILLPGSSFTSPTIEGVDVLYTVTSLSPNTVKVASNAVSKDTKGAVTIPSKVEGYEVTGVTAKAFESVYGLTEIALPTTITTLDENAFYCCYAKEINLPEGLTAIPNKAFYYSDITRITIPALVQTIGSNAFYKCSELVYVFMESATPITIPEDAFPTRANITLFVPDGSREAYKSADYWKDFKEIIVIGDGADKIYCDNKTVYTGFTAEMAVNLTNENTLTAYQFDLELPEGITIATDEDNEYMVTMSNRCTSGEHQLALNKLENNTYRIIYTPINDQATIKGSEGTILTITLNVGQDMNAGQYDANIKDVILTLTDASKIKVMDTLFRIETEKVTRGDANNDGEVDVADIVAMVSYILGNTLPNFNLLVADLNVDREVDIFDVMMAVNIVLNNNSTARSKVRAKYDEYNAEQMYMDISSDNIILSINNVDRFTAFQFDIEMQDGTELMDVRLIGNIGSHILRFAKTGVNSYRVMAVSLDNSPLNATNDGLLELLPNSNSNNVKIDNVKFVTPQGESMHFSVLYDGSTTGIKETNHNQNEVIYDLSGRRINASRENIPKGIYIINNKKVVIQ